MVILGQQKINTQSMNSENNMIDAETIFIYQVTKNLIYIFSNNILIRQLKNVIQICRL